MCPAGMPGRDAITYAMQTCRLNFLNQVEIRMGAVKAHTWKELVEQVEIAEKSAKKFELSIPKEIKVAAKWHNLPKQKGKKPCLWNCQRKLLRKLRRMAPIIRSSSFLHNSTPSKMSR